MLATLNTPFLWIGAVALALTAIVHSLVGEQKVLLPLFRSSASVLQRPYIREMLRFAWHLPSMLCVIPIYMLVAAASGTGLDDRPLVGVIGSVLLATGIFDAIFTRGRHIVWPFLTVAGASTLLALL